MSLTPSQQAETTREIPKRVDASCALDARSRTSNGLLELLGKGGQRRFGQTERTWTVPGKGYRHPAFVSMDKSKHGFGEMHLVEDGSESSSSAGRAAKRQKLVPSGQCWGTGQQNVLEVVEGEHYQLTASGPACWGNAALV